MTQYDNTNRGTLGKNRSPKHERSPKFTGKVDIKRELYWLAGWEQEDFMSDDKYISLAITHQQDDSIKGSGRLNPNPNKIGNQPDMRGTIIINGAEFGIAAWTKSTATGKFLSITVDTTAPNTAYRNTNEPMRDTAPQYNEPPMDFDDDIPF